MSKESIIKNRLEDKFKLRGCTISWLEGQYLEESDTTTSYTRIKALMRNEAEITVCEAIYFAKALEIEDFRELIVMDNE